MSRELEQRGDNFEQVENFIKSPFVEMLEVQWGKQNFVCVGLDSDYELISEAVKKRRYLHGKLKDVITSFNMDIVRATHEQVCAYKLNVAYYEAYGAIGFDALVQTTRLIKRSYPNIPIILDAKMADIGETNKRYAKMAFEETLADAITVQPTPGSSYSELGQVKLDALEPFLSHKDKGIFVWCRSSNKSAGQFQDLPIDLTQLSEEYKKMYGDLSGLRDIVGANIVHLYEVVAYVASRDWNINRNVGLVVGATYPRQLKRVREIVGDMPILVPAVGMQGGTAEAVIRAGLDSRGWGVVVNSSRSIIFASSENDFAQASKSATEKLRNEINKIRQVA